MPDILFLGTCCIVTETFFKICVFTLLLSPLTNNTVMASDVRPIVKEGKIDLSSWNFDTQGTIHLDGEWQFFWQKFLDPHSFPSKVNSDQFYSIPKVWNENSIGGKQLIADSFASYAITIKLDPEKQNTPLVLSTWTIPSAYEIYLNGKRVLANGKPGKTKAEESPQFGEKHYRFIPDRAINTLVLQTSSYNHPHGGTWYPITLQSQESFDDSWVWRTFASLSVMGALFVMGLYHLGIWWMRAKDKTALYFGLFCLCISIRSLFVDSDSAGYYLFPEINWGTSYTLSILPYYLGNVFFPLLMIHTLNSGRLRITLLSCTYVSLGMSGFALFAGTYYTLQSLPIIQFITIVTMTTSVYLVFKNYLDGNRSLGILIFAILALFATVGHDIAAATMLINERLNLATYGLLYYLFTQAYVLATNFSKAYEEVESKTAEIENLNIQLQRNVDDLDERVRITSRKLAQQEKVQSLNKVVANMAHEINNPLMIVTGGIENLKRRISLDQLDPVKLSKSIDIIDKASFRVAKIVETFQSTTMSGNKNDYDQIDIETMLRNLVDKFSVTSKVDLSIVEFEVDQDCSTEILGNPSQIELLLTHLLKNAMDAVTGIDEQWIKIRIFENTRSLVLEISDSGAGIPEDSVEHIFEPFYTSKEMGDGSGLGLTICKSICEAHGGEISLQRSAPHTTFQISFATSSEGDQVA